MLELIRTIQSRDPAKPTFLEVIVGYAGFHVLGFHKIASFFWKLNLRALARFIAQLGRWFTGIEIHPEAKIGKNLFIDHGMGVVIGQTSVIGDNVTLFHGVTLGSRGKCKEPGCKRHPTLEDHVTVGAGAKILGDVTIRRYASVGANAVVTKNVEEGISVIGNPARKVGAHKPGDDAVAMYGMPEEDTVDPILHVIDGLVRDVKALKGEPEKTGTNDAADKTDYEKIWKGSDI